MSAGIQLSLQVTRGGGQLKNQQPSKAPPPPQRKSAHFLSITEQRNVTGTFLKDIRSFHDFQKHLHKKHMDINVVLGPSYAGRSPWNQPSEEVQDRAKAVTSRSNELNDCRGELPRCCRTAASRYITCFQPRAIGETRTNHVVFRNKGPKQHVELTRENKTKGPACLNQQKASNKFKFYPNWNW